LYQDIKNKKENTKWDMQILQEVLSWYRSVEGAEEDEIT